MRRWANWLTQLFIFISLYLCFTLPLLISVSSIGLGVRTEGSLVVEATLPHTPVTTFHTDKYYDNTLYFHTRISNSFSKSSFTTFYNNSFKLIDYIKLSPKLFETQFGIWSNQNKKFKDIPYYRHLYLDEYL